MHLEKEVALWAILYSLEEASFEKGFMIDNESKMNMKKYIFFILLIVSCKNDDNLSELGINYVQSPTSNNLLDGEIIGAESERNSSLFFTEPNGQDGFYFYGTISSENVVGEQDSEGTVLWSEKLDFIIDGFTLYEDLLYVFGDVDSDNNGRSDFSKLNVLSKNGEVLHENVIQVSNQLVDINDCDFITKEDGSKNIILSGSVYQDGTYNPVFFSEILDAQGFPEMDLLANKVVLSEESNLLISEFVADGPLNLLASYTIVEQNFYTGKGVIRLDSSFAKTWRQDLLVNASTTLDKSGNLILDGNRVYVAGSEIVSKEREENRTVTEWFAGYIFSLDKSTGTVRWRTDLNKSYRNDFINGLFIDGDKLLASSRIAHWIESGVSPNLNLGYSGFTSYETNTGNQVAFHSFGNNTLQSGFNCINKVGAFYYLMGYTNSKESFDEGGFYDKWIVKVNESEM